MLCKRPRKVVTKQGTAGLVPCGYCRPCLITKKLQWQFRIQQQERVSDSAYFVTLTYAPIFLPRTKEGIATLRPKHVTNYIKRLRNYEKGEKSIKYYAVGEYGRKGDRPHYHIILFNVLDEENIFKAWQKEIKNENGERERVDIGGVHLGTVTNDSIGYTLGYIFQKPKTLKEKERVREFSRQSQGLGKNYSENEKVRNAYKNNLELNHVVTQNGVKIPIPRYYVEKMYTDEEREERASLAANKTEETIFDIVQRKAKTGEELNEKELKKYKKWLKTAKNQKQAIPLQNRTL